ncbi:BTAD domain-containing putative transcriptional regulator [Streptomyces sp. SID3343]|uniref:AfsR/SARP family transcriptional regulator n=1 Tax=Streptomyces sp. SID3343 TaxID=2690260 RepID=UPI00136DA4F1|nr:BTAD domain-containing putative transcriptional regulator [Streptomyces sp. SID3343]MYW05922.1 regulator protein [Streptomyces sp. SID3343]
MCGAQFLTLGGFEYHSFAGNHFDTEGRPDELAAAMGGTATGRGRRLPLVTGPTGTKQRTMPAALLPASERPLSDTRISRLLWDGDPPSTAGAQIHTYASRLRKRLGVTVPITRLRSGYRIDISQVWCDRVEFEEPARTSQATPDSGQWARAAELLRRALDLWAGEALADGTKRPAETEGLAWEERRLAVHESRIEVDLALGRNRALIAELIGLVAEFPLQERFRAQLMIALARSARQAGAVRLFNEGRRLLVDELGVDPSWILTDTYQERLTGDVINVIRVPAPTRPVASVLLNARFGAEQPA